MQLHGQHGNHHKAHNTNIISKDMNKPEGTCNCWRKEDCPLPNKCTTQSKYIWQVYLAVEGWWNPVHPDLAYKEARASILPKIQEIQFVPLGEVLYNNSRQKNLPELLNRTGINMQAQEKIYACWLWLKGQNLPSLPVPTCTVWPCVSVLYCEIKLQLLMSLLSFGWPCLVSLQIIYMYIYGVGLHGVCIW